MKTKGISD